MPLPTVQSIEDLEGLEDLLREALRGRRTVRMGEISETIVVIRPCKEDLLAVSRCLRAIGFDFDKSSNEYVYHGREIERKIGELRAKHRAIISYAIRRCKRAKRSKEDDVCIGELGCSVNEFRKWISGQFEEGMTWDNHGEWNIEHRRALHKFDFLDERQYLMASHWSNLRPLWSYQNRRRPRG